ncbi:hypothetical protein [Sphingomonas montanisoli]|uniref:Uncharacterized protein n=1 Tax=Sphingomonas montanisoli TaxID=2606412 RepID=A0A5D9C241_9SPHN|nr:hypothetical protein [Sphingomonas montanisoli]TZG25824.1 hypothetical protein FYJ91_12625 [Sphingomonas montanisoli]
MTATQLQTLLIRLLVRAHGGDIRSWRQALGPVRRYDVATHPHCNWAVAPSGSARQNGAIEDLCDQVRGEHPIIGE